MNFQTTNFSPEFGRAGGAVVSQVTRSGTNAVHGSLAYVYRAQVFDASTQTQRNAYTSNLATYQSAVVTNPNYPVPVLKNKYHENIPAFTIGGPVLIPHLYNGRDKTFFFVGGQWDRYSSNALTTFSNVPTDSAYTTLKALAATGACPNVASYLNLLAAAGNPVGSSDRCGNVSTVSIERFQLHWHRRPATRAHARVSHCRWVSTIGRRRTSRSTTTTSFASTTALPTSRT